jgi:hypothetical protein
MPGMNSGCLADACHASRRPRTESGRRATYATMVTAAALAATMFLAGCASAAKSGAGNVGALSPSSSVSVGEPGIGSAAPASATPSGTPANGGGGGAPTYPSTDKDYTRAVLDAYDTHASTRLAQLTVADGPTVFANLGSLDKHWHFHACGNDGALRQCTYDNNNGDRISIDLDPASLGKPHAVTTAFVDRTHYGNTADAMVGDFMQAWFDGNTSRMTALGDATATSYATGSGNAPESWNLSDAPSGASPGHTIVTVATVDGRTLLFDVTDSKVGHPHAFTKVTV